MQIYLVGGAVRDKLLGRAVKEKDWVVVGATVEELLRLGYRQVGKDFPVFIHPQTGEEYALARTERKVSRGYTGFSFDVTPQVTLEEDLQRRDLTINAMAETQEGVLVDPYHGKEDLAQKILRHVSPAFVEDPVRILRVARFAARFAFTIAPETLKLMQEMVTSGEVDALVPERVWKELERALSEPYPENFFASLAACGALEKLFPELAQNFRNIKWDGTNDPKVRFSALLHTLSITNIETLCARYRVPTDYRELSLLVKKYLSHYQQTKKLTAIQLLDVLASTDAFRREARFKDFLLACELCTGTSQSIEWLQCYAAAKAVNAKEIASDAVGKEIADQLKHKRCAAIQKWLDSA
jgi:tRNA nucleotidyltransferase (CCA-adding enzyme)